MEENSVNANIRIPGYKIVKQLGTGGMGTYGSGVRIGTIRIIMRNRRAGIERFPSRNNQVKNQ